MPNLPHAKNLRAGRYSESGQIYLLTAVVQHREPLFTDLRTGRLLVREFQNAQAEDLVESQTWVIMPDHFHWLVELKKCTLPTLMRGTKSRSARMINAHLGRSGRLWQKKLSRSGDPAGRGFIGSGALCHRQPGTRGTRQVRTRLPVVGCEMGVVGILLAVVMPPSPASRLLQEPACWR